MQPVSWHFHSLAYPATLANVTLNGHTVKLLSRIDNKAMIQDVRFCDREEVESGSAVVSEMPRLLDDCTHSDKHISQVPESDSPDPRRNVV